MNVYLPDALKADMDSIEGVSWSQIAQDAFREAIIRSKAMTQDVAAVTERLRGTAGANSTAYRQGYEAGRQWAAELAELDELEEVVRREFLDTSDLGHTLRQVFEVGFGYDDAQELIGGFPSSNRVKGFCDGAEAIYNAVRDKL